MAARAQQISVDEYFDGLDPQSRQLFDALLPMIEQLGEVEMRVTKSQVSFSRRIAFAWAWNNERYLGFDHGLAPLVLSVGLRRRDESPRWKQVVEPQNGRFIHHLELRSEDQLDDEVRAWLREAWENAA